MNTHSKLGTIVDCEKVKDSAKLNVLTLTPWYNEAQSVTL